MIYLGILALLGFDDRPAETTLRTLARSESSFLRRPWGFFRNRTEFDREQN